MNLLSLILVAMALIVAGCVFYVAWQFSSGEFESSHAKSITDASVGNDNESTKKEPDESKESSY